MKNREEKNRVKTWWVSTTIFRLSTLFRLLLSAGILLIYELFISYLIILSIQCIYAMRAYLYRTIFYFFLSFFFFISIYFLRAVFRSIPLPARVLAGTCFVCLHCPYSWLLENNRSEWWKKVNTHQTRSHMCQTEMHAYTFHVAE